MVLLELVELELAQFRNLAFVQVFCFEEVVLELFLEHLFRCLAEKVQQPDLDWVEEQECWVACSGDLCQALSPWQLAVKEV